MKKIKITEIEEGFFVENEFFFGADLIRDARFVPRSPEVASKISELLTFLECGPRAE